MMMQLHTDCLKNTGTHIIIIELLRRNLICAHPCV